MAKAFANTLGISQAFKKNCTKNKQKKANIPPNATLANRYVQTFGNPK